MGQEAVCRIVVDGEMVEGKALLETDEVILRGPKRMRIPLADIASVEAHDGRLVISSNGHSIVLEIGRQAERWAERIRNPPSLLDKLGVAPGARVAVVGPHDGFVDDLKTRTLDVSTRLRRGCDLVFMWASDRRDLERLARVEPHLGPKGALWVVYPKGVDAVRESDVLEAGRAAGLVDNKVARFSATHTALRFVVPVARRAEGD